VSLGLGTQWRGKVPPVIGLGPRRLAVVGILAGFIGAVVNVVLVLANGGGLAGGYVAGLLGGYLFYGSVGLIAVGAGIAGVTQRGAGVALMLIAALFLVGFVIGSQISLRLLIIP
jgi:hypothetical protein